MAISTNPFLPYPERVRHQNPLLPVAYAEDIQGGRRVVANLTELYALSGESVKLQEQVTIVYVTDQNADYKLINLANAGNSSGWLRIIGSLPLSGLTDIFVPYNGANKDVNLAQYYITAGAGYLGQTFQSLGHFGGVGNTDAGGIRVGGYNNFLYYAPPDMGTPFGIMSFAGTDNDAGYVGIQHYWSSIGGTRNLSISANGELSFAAGNFERLRIKNNGLLGTFDYSSGYTNNSFIQKGYAIATFEPVIAASDATKYWRGDKTWQTLLDGGGKIVSSLLPSYVDDVVEVANFASLPVTGEMGKIYITIDNNKVYRWGGSVYIELVSSPGSTDAVPEGSINLYYHDYLVAAYSDTHYYPLSSNPAGYLTSFTETDPTVPAYAKTLSAFSVIKTSGDSVWHPLEDQRVGTAYSPTWAGGTFNGALVSAYNTGVGGLGVTANSFGKTLISNNRSNAQAETDIININGTAPFAIGGFRFITVSTGGTETVMLNMNGSTNNAEFVGNVYSTGFFQTSQRELKTDIAEYNDDALSLINKLKLNKFKFKNKLSEEHIGFIVDEVDGINDDILNTDKTAINKDNLIAQLTRAVQQLSEELGDVKCQLGIV